MTKLKRNRLIVVLGMHRSGTSAITRGLQVLGADIGDRLMPPVDGNNAKGFWEDIDLNALNIDMLHAIGSDWSCVGVIESSDVETLHEQGYFLRAVELLRAKVGSTPIFAFKDPRVAKLLPFWKDVFTHSNLDVDYVLAIRNPLSVVTSLMKRDGLDAEQSYLLWLSYVITSLTYSAGKKRVFVDYDRLLQSPDHELNRIAKHLDLEIDPVKLQTYKTEFLDEGLRHALYNPSDLLLDKACPQLVYEVYSTLLGVASDSVGFDNLESKVASWLVELERLKSPLMLIDKLLAQKTVANQAAAERDVQIVNLNQAAAERDVQIVNLNQVVAERDVQIVNLNQVVAEQDKAIKAIKKSFLWRVTRPLQKMINKGYPLLVFGRRAVKLIWWTMTLQIGKRLREWWLSKNVISLRAPHFAPITEDFSLQVPFDYKIEKNNFEPTVAVICHIYYPELLEEFKGYLANIPFSFDLFITTDTEQKKNDIVNGLLDWNKGAVEVRTALNRGRDIAPKLISCRDVYDRYEFFLHIHSKKSPHLESLSGWRSYLLDTLLGSREVVESIFEAFESDPKLGMIAPEHFDAVRGAIGWGWNFEAAKKLSVRLGIKLSLDEKIDFPSGSMLWGRSAALKPLLESGLSVNDFEPEDRQLDGTLGHVIERLYYFICEKAGYRWVKIARSELLKNAERVIFIENRESLKDLIKKVQCGPLI